VWADPASPDLARRHITLRAARASEKLAHAIEYLADEFIRDETPPAAQSSRLEAVQLLMALKRAIYLECPEEPTLAERCQYLFRSGRW
jgi:hypothetical protein